MCQCCEWRYSHTKYSKKGQLCKQCEKYYKAAALGEFEEHHDPGNDRGLVSKTENTSKKYIIYIVYNTTGFTIMHKLSKTKEM